MVTRRKIRSLKVAARKVMKMSLRNSIVCCRIAIDEVILALQSFELISFALDFCKVGHTMQEL